MSSKVYIAPGQAVFVHECEGHRHSVTVGWSAGTPALDENSLPPCADCGAAYERVSAGADDPIAGRVDRSDDPMAGLVAPPDPADPLELKQQRREFVRWVIGQKQVIEQTAALLKADNFPDDWLREDCQLTHELAIAQLRAREIDPFA